MRYTPYHRCLCVFGTACLCVLSGVAPAFGIPPVQQSLLVRLAADQFNEREKAQEELLQWARQDTDAAKDLLYDLSQQHSDPEVRRRCTAALRALVDDEFARDGEGYVGMRMLDVAVNVPGDARNRWGMSVAMVAPDSPALRAGLRVGDQVVGVDDLVWLQPSSEEFTQWIRKHKPGARVTLHVLRGAQKMEDLQIELARRPLMETVFPPPPLGSPEFKAMQRQAKEEYFRKWMSEHKGRHPVK